MIGHLDIHWQTLRIDWPLLLSATAVGITLFGATGRTEEPLDGLCDRSLARRLAAELALSRFDQRRGAKPHHPFVRRELSNEVVGVRAAHRGRRRQQADHAGF